MNEPSGSRVPLWQQRLERIRAFVRAAAPFSAGVLAALAALILYSILFPGPHTLTQSEVNSSISQVLASATAPPAYSQRVYQIIRPSLVLIQTKSTDSDGKVDNGLGSGVVINDRGDVLTALHVVRDASDIKLTFADGTESSASVAVKQPSNDIAVLHADQLPQLLIPAVLGNPNALQVGDEVYAVGNPFGLYSSMSAGVISGFGRSFQPSNNDQKLEGLIQMDTAVNPGNSGGPLLNRNGLVIGIVEGLANPTDQNFFIGIGFAVPIDAAVTVFGGGSPID